MKVLEIFHQHAVERPDQPAIICRGVTTSFGDLARMIREIAAGLLHSGCGEGQRLGMLLPPSAELVAVAFAALSVGAVPVFVDPGLGLRRLRQLLATSGAAMVVGTPLTLTAAIGILPAARRLCTHAWTGKQTLAQLRRHGEIVPSTTISGNAPGIMLHTSGATGVPKAITIARDTLDAQAAALCALAELGPGCTLLTILPAMLLIGPAAGCTCRVPGPRRQLAEDLAASTHSFGSPAVWGPLAELLAHQKRHLPELRCLLFGGCAVPRALLERWRHVAPNARLASVYGATEGIPVCVAWADKLPDPHTHDEGTCLGYVTGNCELELKPLAGLADGGEIRVRGPVMAACGWQSLGDLGRRDHEGRWWYLGRAAEAVSWAGALWPTEPVETAFQNGLLTTAVALVNPDGRPLLVVEPRCWPLSRSGRSTLIAEVLAQDPALVSRLALNPKRVLLRRVLPRDVRHRAKILRGELATWAAARLLPETIR